MGLQYNQVQLQNKENHDLLEWYQLIFHNLETLPPKRQDQTPIPRLVTSHQTGYFDLELIYYQLFLKKRKYKLENLPPINNALKI